PAEQVRPDAIDEDAGRQRAILRRDPFGQFLAAALGRADLERGLCHHLRRPAREAFAARLVRLAAGVERAVGDGPRAAKLSETPLRPLRLEPAAEAALVAGAHGLELGRAVRMMRIEPVPQ